MADLDWQERILIPLLESDPKQALQKIGADMSERVIVFAADTDRTQDYVFESDKLPEIRGGSRQLSELNDGEVLTGQLFRRLGLSKECLLYAGGGSVLALLPDDDSAAQLAERMEMAYAQRTGAATITCVWRQFSASQILNGLGPEPGGPVGKPKVDDHQSRVNLYFTGDRKQSPKPKHIQKRKHFGEIILLMGMLLRRAKQERLHKPFIELMPFAQLCASCQSRPAAGIAHKDITQPICEVCQRKLKIGGAGERHYWVEELYDDLKAAQYPLDDRPHPPADIAQVADGKDVAFIYADGDSIGEKLHGLQTPNDYVAFSQNLYQVTKRAVAQALTDSGLTPYKYTDSESGATYRVHPWEVVTIGGDDVLIIIRAKNAPEFVSLLGEYFMAEGEKAFAQFKFDEPVRMSVGFAIGKPKTPVRVLREAAYKALRHAKKRAYREEIPCVDFHNFIKEGAVGEDISTLREQTQRVDEITRLTGRPYTLEEFAQIRKNIATLKGFPRSQLYRITSELSQGKVRGSLFYYYQRARMGHDLHTKITEIETEWLDETRTERLRRLLPGKSEAQKRKDLWPWLERAPDDHYTIIPDIVDLLS